MASRSLKKASFYKIILLIIGGYILAGCSMPGDQALLRPQIEVTMTPTPDSLGYQAIAPGSCKISEWTGIQTDQRQGDLIAWRPGNNELVYIAPNSNSTWYSGNLSLASGESLNFHNVLADTILAQGDLTWSPDGEKLAFIAFRVDEGIQTVMVYQFNTNAFVDLFPLDSARTDTRTSQKSILKWVDSNRVHILTSCGEDCQQIVEVNTQLMATEPISAAQRKNIGATFNPAGVKKIDGLELTENVLEYDPDKFPRGFSAPNWSPDQSKVLYLDRRGLLWLLNLDDKTQFILDIGFRVVNETKWSSDGQLIAIRAEDRIYIFQAQCQS